MNTVKAQLSAIFGNRMPKTATSFYTSQGLGCFVGGRIKGMTQIPLTQPAIKKLTTAGLIGARGWSLQ